MSHLLIIFERCAQNENANHAVRIFTDVDRRQYYSKKLGNININHYHHENRQSPFFENELYLVCIVGEVYKIENKLLKKEKTGNYLLEYITKNGTENIPDIDGEFTLFFYHKTKDEAYIFNDRFGFYPLYYFKDKDNIVICNEIEPIIGYLKDNICYDNDAVAGHFCLDHVVGNKTFYKDINNLAPGTKIMIDREFSFHTSTYITNRIRTIENPEVNDIAHQLALLLKKAVEKRMFSSEKNTFTLTAGLDTRMITECARKNSRHGQHFITYLDLKLTEETDQDVMIARQIATKSHLNLSVKEYDFFDEEMDTNYYQKIRKNTLEKYFSGVFGSELVRCEINNALDPDYYNFIMSLEKQKGFQHLRFLQKRKSFEKKIDSKLKFFNKDFIKTINHPIENIEKEYFLHKYYENRILYYFILIMTRSFYLNIYGGTRSYLMERPGNILFLYKTPFLDKDLLLFLLTIPYKFYSENIVKIYNILFTKYFTEYQDILTNSSFTSNPDFVVGRLNSGINQVNVRDYKSKVITDYAIHNNSFLDFVFDKPVSSLIFDSDPLLKQKIIDFTLWSKYIKEVTE